MFETYVSYKVNERSSLERKNFVKLKETQLLKLVIKLTKLFAAPKACTRLKTKRGISVIFFELIVTLLLFHSPIVTIWISFFGKFMLMKPLFRTRKQIDIRYIKKMQTRLPLQ